MPALPRFNALPTSLAALRQHRWWRPARRGLVGLLALWALAWVAVPPLLKSQLQRIASQELGRTVTLESVDFRPWSLELTLRGLEIATADGAQAQLRVERIYADAELQSLLRWAPVVDALQVDGPHLRLTHLGDGRYDVDDVLAKVMAPSPTPSEGPARLALHNLALRDGQVDFDDRTVNARHEVRALALSVPFISTLPSQREVKVQPRLAFSLNGSHFDTAAEGTPFAQTGEADAHVRWEGLDLQPYLAYLPASVPVKVRSATLDMDVKVDFQQRPQMTAAVTGWVQARQVKLMEPQGADLLAFDTLRVEMADVHPLLRQVHLAKVELAGAQIDARRDAAGTLNWAQLAPRTAGEGPAKPSPTGSATPAKAASRASQPAGEGPLPPAWAVTVDEVAVHGTTVRWADASTRPAASVPVRDITLSLKGLGWPVKAPATLQGSMELPGGRLTLAGEGTDRQAQLTVTAKTLDLGLAAPYLNAVLEPSVSGFLNGDLGLRWVAEGAAAASATASPAASATASAAAAPAAPAASAPGPTVAPRAPDAPGLTLVAGPLTVDQLALRQGRELLAGWSQLELAGLALDPARRTLVLERLALNQPRVQLERDDQGRWMVERWLTAPATSPAAPSVPNEAAPTDTPWKWRLNELAVNGASVGWADRSQPRAVALQLSNLQLAARNLASDGSKPEALSLSTRMTGGTGKAGEAGKLDFQGTLALQPLALEGKIDAARLPLHALDGYLARQLSIELLRADASFRGQAAFAQTAQGPRLRVSGDATLDDLRANSTAASTPKTEAQVGEELLAWKRLNLRGLSVAMAPATAPRVEVAETGLTDFFARITVNEQGQINLRDIASPPQEVQARAEAAAAAPAAMAAPPLPPAPANAATTDPLAPVVRFGPVSLVNGRVLFSDFFIRPNYSADLSQLTGQLSAFSTELQDGAPVLADLQLRGRAEGSASLEITGKLNPLAKPLALDIQGKVRDLDLPPLSPYAVKYAGHGIERGKLRMDVAYQVLPNGQLTASNRLVLNQLTFGDPVEGAPNSLPVRLAVALLSDRNGVIDLDLPISGSLNDPQFRIGPVIFKIIGNLIAKAVTAPFALLASALGGSQDEMGQITFAPGSATLSAEARQNLDKIARAMQDRPALRLTVAGTAYLAEERAGLQRARLDQLVLAEKRRAQPADTGPVQEAEYPALLKEVYRRTDMAKPRNLVGLAKDLTVPEMEALLLAHQPATEAAAQELATQRGQAVRNYLLEQQMPTERLFVAAPHLVTAGDKAASSTWKPHAELNLATQ